MKSGPATHNDLVNMEYLHGIVTGGEFDAACFYEYAREFQPALDLVAMRDRDARGKRGQWKAHCRNVALLALQKLHCSWFSAPLWRSIWQCPSFPKKRWNRLSERERRAIAVHFKAIGIPPLATDRTGELAEMGVIDSLKEAPPESVPVVNDTHERQKTRVMFTLDFSESKNRMLRRFEIWCDQPENKKRFRQFQRDAIGTTGESKDRLKDLAVAQLYKIFPFDGLLQFTDKNRMRKHGKPLPFHDARPGKSKTPLNEAQLCSEESFCLKAVARVQKHAKEIMPVTPRKMSKKSC